MQSTQQSCSTVTRPPCKKTPQEAAVMLRNGTDYSLILFLVFFFPPRRNGNGKRTSRPSHPRSHDAGNRIAQRSRLRRPDDKLRLCPRSSSRYSSEPRRIFRDEPAATKAYLHKNACGVSKRTGKFMEKRTFGRCPAWTMIRVRVEWQQPLFRADTR